MYHTPRIELTPLDSLEFLVQISECLDYEWKTQSHRVELDTHAYRRSRERNISQEEIAAAMLYGYSEWKQGVCFYALTREMVPERSGIEYRRSEGLIIICDECSAKVKTCFRRNDPINYVKKKPKYNRPKNQYMRLQRVERGQLDVYELESYRSSKGRKMIS